MTPVPDLTRNSQAPLAHDSTGEAPVVADIHLPVLCPHHTRSGKEITPEIVPLRVLASLLPGQEQPFLVYTPFASSDLYNWKRQTPSFSEKPQALIELLDSIFSTHQPTWEDIQKLLQVLFTTEERERILSLARKAIPGDPVKIPILPPLLFP